MMKDLIKVLRDYQHWMKDSVDRHGDVGPSIGIDDIDGDETFGAAADALERMQWNTDMDTGRKAGGLDNVLVRSVEGVELAWYQDWHDRWLTPSGKEVRAQPTKWMHLP